MKLCSRFVRDSILSLILIGLASQSVQAEDRTRSFPDCHCKFTLPGTNWTWLKDTATITVFTANNKKGVIVILNCQHGRDDEKMDQSFVASFEKGFGGQIVKREGRFLNFRGQKCYQFEGLQVDHGPFTTRNFFANGFLYSLIVTGLEPGTPEFNAIMAGFVFPMSSDNKEIPLTTRNVNDRTRTFGKYQCEYTLPDKDWSWFKTPSNPEKNVCRAQNEKGEIAMLLILKMGLGQKLDQELITKFERDFQSRGLEKCGGRFITFKGLPGYQLECLPNYNTFPPHGACAGRFVIAHDLIYQIALFGSQERVENTPEFERVMNSFEFLAPSEKDEPVTALEAAKSPAASAQPQEQEQNIAYMAGHVIAYCVFAAVVVFVLRQFMR